MREVRRRTLSVVASRDSLSLCIGHDELSQNLNSSAVRAGRLYLAYPLRSRTTKREATEEEPRGSYAAFSVPKDFSVGAKPFAYSGKLESTILYERLLPFSRPCVTLFLAEVVPP